MNTRQTEYKTDIATMAGQTESAIDRLRANLANWETDLAKQNTCLILIGLVMTLSMLGLYIRTFFAGA